MRIQEDPGMTDPVQVLRLRTAPLWKRALAQVVDLVAYLPFHLAMAYGAELGAQWGTMVPFALAILVYIPIPVAFTALRGATFGKMALGLRVVVPGLRSPGWRHAWNRQGLFIAVLLLTVLEQGAVMARLGPGSTFEQVVEEAAADPSGWGWVAHVSVSLVWASALLVLLRSDRRGLHDLWGGSTVVEIPKVRRWKA
jgi:uncharacterized RDD family membrane protein YckC